MSLFLLPLGDPALQAKAHDLESSVSVLPMRRKTRQADGGHSATSPAPLTRPRVALMRALLSFLLTNKELGPVGRDHQPGSLVRTELGGEPCLSTRTRAEPSREDRLRPFGGTLPLLLPLWALRL